MERISATQDRYQKAFESYQKLFSLSDEDLQKSILDVGAGRGEFVHYLRETLGNKNAYGVEKNNSKIESGEEGMVIANGFRLPFPDESFELVLAKNYLPMFVQDEEKMAASLQELLRVTKPEGRIIGDISTPENVIKDWGEYKTLRGYDNNTENWFAERYKAAQKLILYLETIKEGGMKIDRKNDVVTLYKS